VIQIKGTEYEFTIFRVDQATSRSQTSMKGIISKNI